MGGVRAAGVCAHTYRHAVCQRSLCAKHHIVIHQIRVILHRLGDAQSLSLELGHGQRRRQGAHQYRAAFMEGSQLCRR